MFYSNMPISAPILYPDEEVVYFGGFAWSNVTGMIFQTSTDKIPQAGKPTQWLGTQA